MLVEETKNLSAIPKKYSVLVIQAKGHISSPLVQLEHVKRTAIPHPTRSEMLVEDTQKPSAWMSNYCKFTNLALGVVQLVADKNGA